MPKITKKRKEDLKKNKIEMNDSFKKEKKFISEVPLVEFIVPNRKRTKNENSKITTSTLKRKKTTLKVIMCHFAVHVSAYIFYM